MPQDDKQLRVSIERGSQPRMEAIPDIIDHDPQRWACCRRESFDTILGHPAGS